MCGFVGRIRGRQDWTRPIEAALPVLARRGPDGYRIWRSPCGRIELLHARLAIVDPDERALQPFADLTGEQVLAFNGEIYNYLELKQRWPEPPFRTDSDTEVLMRGLASEGAGMLGRVRGMYSGVWVDLRRGSVSVFRDPVGKKPLFLWRDANGTLLFGSSLQALRALYGGTIEVDPEAVRQVYAQGYVDPPGAIYRGAEDLRPGEWLCFDLDGALRRRERIVLDGLPCYAGEALPEVVERVGALLDQAVERRLTNNPAPAVLLSGGIDSTVVAAALIRRCDTLSAYSLKPLLPATQDAPYARAAARRLELRLTWVTPGHGQIADRVLAALDAQDQPLAMVAYFYLWELVRAVRPYSKILLTGDGGDEVFLGYGQAEDWSSKALHTRHPEVIVGVDPPGWFGPWARHTVGGSLLGHMLQKADRASAEQGVELRCPLLDIDLLAYARSLPLHHLLHGRRTKALLKAQLAGWPEAFLERPKLGFAYPFRWAWSLSNFAGLREHVDPALQDALMNELPAPLKRPASRWSALQILRHFQSAYALLALSRALRPPASHLPEPVRR